MGVKRRIEILRNDLRALRELLRTKDQARLIDHAWDELGMLEFEVFKREEEEANRDGGIG
jgi:hypothetical protein